jgi:hypothetical protein
MQGRRTISGLCIRGDELEEGFAWGRYLDLYLLCDGSGVWDRYTLANLEKDTWLMEYSL